MNQKVLAALSITAIIIGVVNLMLFLLPDLAFNSSQSQSIFSPNQKIPLRVTDIALNNATEYYVIQVDASLPEENPTLFNCYIKVDYLTESGSWKTTSRNIGIVNYPKSVHENLMLDADFKADDPYTRPDNYFHRYNSTNVKIEVYGYLKP